MIYKHKNWGGKFEIKHFSYRQMAVHVLVKPEQWEFMRKLGWDDTTILPKTDLPYFVLD